MAALLRLHRRLSPRARRTLVGACLAAGLAALIAGMLRGSGLLIMLGLLFAGIANVWRSWSEPSPSAGPAHVERSILPGVGAGLRLPNSTGTSVGVIRYADGRRELAIYAHDDPDTVRASLVLTPQEAHEVADALQVHTATDLAQDVGAVGEHDIVVARLRVPATSSHVGRSIRDLRTDDVPTGRVRNVAVLRDGYIVAGPPPEYVITGDDVLVVAGDHEAVLALHRLLADEGY